MDPNSEHFVQEALDHAAKGGTTTAIVQKLSTTQNGDCMCVFCTPVEPRAVMFKLIKKGCIKAYGDVFGSNPADGYETLVGRRARLAAV